MADTRPIMTLHPRNSIIYNGLNLEKSQPFCKIGEMLSSASELDTGRSFHQPKPPVPFPEKGRGSRIELMVINEDVGLRNPRKYLNENPVQPASPAAIPVAGDCSWIE
jgi:hypothetical protein